MQHGTERISLLELGERLAASPGWAWLPGALAIGRDGRKARHVGGGAWALASDRPALARLVSMPEGAIPDLDDAATFGTLLALVERAGILEGMDARAVAGLVAVFCDHHRIDGVDPLGAF